MFVKIVITAVFAASLIVAQDYDYDGESKLGQAPARIRSGYSGPAAGPKQAAAAPVAILKQINRHNEDGSYTYGYESADGSFKIETKAATGEVKGKYGFVDDKGKVRVVEYGATKFGFAPQGEGITIPPPTLVDETTLKDGRPNPEYQEQQYDQEPAQQPQTRPAPHLRPQQNVFDSYSSPLQFAPRPQSNPIPVPQKPVFPGGTLTDIEFGSYQPKQPTQNFGQQASVYRPAAQQAFSYEPAPIQEEDNYAEQTPSFSPFRPAGISRPAPVQFAKQLDIPQGQPQFTQVRQAQPAPAPPQAQRQNGPGGILDQLAKDYALPSGGSPALHDISFGYY